MLLQAMNVRLLLLNLVRIPNILTVTMKKWSLRLAKKTTWTPGSKGFILNINKLEKL